LNFCEDKVKELGKYLLRLFNKNMSFRKY